LPKKFPKKAKTGLLVPESLKPCSAARCLRPVALESLPRAVTLFIALFISSFDLKTLTSISAMADNKDKDKDEAPPQPTTPAAPPQPTTPAGVSQPTTSDDQSGSGSTGVPLCRLCFTRHGVKEKCPVCDNVATRLYQRLLNEFRHDFAPCSQHNALEIGPFNVDA
jgi:hypothetical protein